MRLHPVPTPGECFYLGTAELKAAAEECLEQARDRLLAKLEESLLNPGQLIELEESLHQEVGRCLDLFVARLIQAAHFDAELITRASKLAGMRPCLRLQDRGQEVTITLLGGSQVTVTSPYMLNRPKKKRGRPKENKTRGRNGNGLYPVLEILGIRYRVTPALASEVARQMALGTVSQTQDNLATRGIYLGRKKIRAIALAVGERSLQFRREVIEGSTKGGSQNNRVEGSTLLIGTDGGRLRTRVSKRGRKKKSGHHGYRGEWREPKVTVVSEINEKGRKKKNGYQRYDATLEDCNGAFRHLAGHLRMIGAEKATRWVFVGDGADWIWNRIEELCEEVGFPLGNVIQVVDFYHANQRVHAFADEVKSWTKVARKKWTKRATKLLYAGKIDELHALCSEYFRGCNSKKRRSLAEYFVTHKERMRYRSFREAKIPMGSGAIESCVRRLINLRFKGNGIFWKEENAEAVLQLRAQLLSARWKLFVNEIFDPVELWNKQDKPLSA
jgi:hypothetical protein